MKKTYILGISAFYHDSAAAIICDGEVIAAAQEERFTRIKHDKDFPTNSISYCLDEANIPLDQVGSIVFYDKPLLKFDRILETYFSQAPKGFKSFCAAMPVWLKEKLFLKDTIKRELSQLSGIDKKELPKLYFSEHHHSHSASAFFPSPFNEAVVLTMDGVGEWATTSAWVGKDNQLEPLWQIDFPHSLGLLYSAFTYFCGFKVNSGEYKLMGLAPYGKPIYCELIKENLIKIKEDGSFRLNMKYFNFLTGLTMTNKKFENLFGIQQRQGESEITQDHMDLAASIQSVTEEVVIKLASSLQKETGLKNLCLAGGVALNCVANGKLLKEGTFENIWIQPAAGDAGGALGAALALWHQYFKKPKEHIDSDSMKGSYLGPSFNALEIKEQLDRFNAVYEKYEEQDLLQRTAESLANSKVVGWFQGRMEFGPRALGGRSILGDARSVKMQSVLNLKIKFRESFRPFAPAVLAEDVGDYFEQESSSPYMLLVAKVKENRRKQMTPEQLELFGIEKLNVPRSDIPAVTHIDYSARIQTVHDNTNPRFYNLLKAFKNKTKYSVLVNTSFNVRGEPIVCQPADAYKCFMRTHMDELVIGDFVLKKENQPHFVDSKKWQEEFTLD